ncbi:MAG: glycerate kinase, partial [Acholeplasmataceae bacterium]
MSKKFVIIPDSFKGTLSSIEVCDIIETEILNVFNDAEIKKIPVADGGEGSVDAFLEGLKGEKVFVEVNDPFFQKMTSFYGLIDQGETAVIEMAACAGLPLVGNKKNPRITTTYGVGELLLHAIEHGVKKVILGIGGSSTNDGGCGFAAALGVKFYNQNHETFIPTGGTLHQIHQIDKSNLDKRLNQIELITMCDIDNPLFGKEGAAYVFGPQKGADPEMVEFLDQGLKHLA